MLSSLILNSDATLNNFQVIGAVEFIPGEQFRVYVRILNTQLDLRYIPPATNITTITLNNVDGTTLAKTGTHLADDRSIFYFDVQETESAELVGGSISFQLDELGDASQIKKGLIQNGLAKIVEGSC